MLEHFFFSVLFVSVFVFVAAVIYNVMYVILLLFFFLLQLTHDTYHSRKAYHWVGVTVARYRIYLVLILFTDFSFLLTFFLDLSIVEHFLPSRFQSYFSLMFVVLIIFM